MTQQASVIVTQKITEAEKKRRFETFQAFEYSMLEDMKERDGRVKESIQQIYQPKNERILRWAEEAGKILALDIDLGIKKENEIASYIRGKLREAGLSVGSINYIDEVLPAKYKQDKYNPHRGKDFLTPSDDIQQPVQELTNSQVQKEVAELAPALQKIRESKRRMEDRFEELIERARSDRIAIEVPSKHIPKSTPKGEPKQTESYDALGWLLGILEGMRQKIYELPPSKEEDPVIAEAIRSFGAIFQPFTDEKYTKSMPDWFDVQLGNIPAYTILPDGGKRKLTRKRVHMSEKAVLHKARKFCDSIPIIKYLAAWHRSRVEPQVAQRKVELRAQDKAGRYREDE